MKNLDYKNILKSRLDDENHRKLMKIKNEKLHKYVADAINLCNPESVWVSTDSLSDIKHTREMAVKQNEERVLALEGHTYHFDGMEDQGRDREVTKYLVPAGEVLSKSLNQIEREEGLQEVRGLMKDSMKERIMIVRFMTLGPRNSEFSTPCIECTDSFYVSHSLNLLYRPGYDEFVRLGNKAQYFSTLHSCGIMDERMVSTEVDKKRIYIDYTTDSVYSINTQYAGNTVGLKKLALRLSIRKADREGWLAEHMFLMGVYGKKNRKSYFAGAFPSACGKTSTAMLPGETILGDDIAYFRAVKGKCMAANAEAGIFGIIQNVNDKDDPAIWEVLNKPGEVIFSNILISGKKPYWLGMGTKIPESGENFSGNWEKGKIDSKGNEILCAHKNARYAVALKDLSNCDLELENPKGIELSVIMYGGRDAKAYVPVQQSFSWEHGIVAYGASLETETTFAIIGKEGVPEINLMSIQDFVAIPLGKYVSNNLEFGKKLTRKPLIFGVNYFLRNKKGQFVNGVRDKHIWIKWMELRVHNETGAHVTPTGLIPEYDILVQLFKQVLNKEYTKDNYIEQFSIRVPENLSKIDRVIDFHKTKVEKSPSILFDILTEQRKHLEEAQKKHGDYISPFSFPLE